MNQRGVAMGKEFRGKGSSSVCGARIYPTPISGVNVQLGPFMYVCIHESVRGPDLTHHIGTSCVPLLRGAIGRGVLNPCSIIHSCLIAAISFGGDPYLSGEAAYESIIGIQSQGVQAVAKHFINKYAALLYVSCDSSHPPIKRARTFSCEEFFQC